jgi:hypothetical protein
VKFPGPTQLRTSGVNQNDGFKRLVVVGKRILKISALVQSDMLSWGKTHVSQNEPNLKQTKEIDFVVTL